MRIFEQYGIDIGYVIMGMAGVIILLFIMLIVALVKNSNTRSKYEEFMEGKDGKSLEELMLDKFDAINQLENNVEDLYEKTSSMRKQLVTTYQKMGMVKYDAFSEIGGKLSFVLVLLTEDDNGFILNSMHSTKDGCYTYAKEVINGEVFVILSEEEQQALDNAKANKGIDHIA